MKNWRFIFHLLVSSLAVVLVASSCKDESSATVSPDPTKTDFTDLLTNQADGVIIPTMEKYQVEMAEFMTAVNGFASSTDEANLISLRLAYKEAYLSYQSVAVHNYFAVSSQDIVMNTNLYPVDTTQLNDFIANESYNFNTKAQERANGFPALDFMLYGNSDVVAYFNADSKRIDFLKQLVEHMKSKADVLEDQWSNRLREPFIGSSGTGLGSAINTQLNSTLVYYEDHVRGNKVGIPIGRLGPNDSPTVADPKKIESFYESQSSGNEEFTFQLLKASVEEMEDIYLGTTYTTDSTGYDDLVILRDATIDTDVKNQFTKIYDEIENRSSISGDESLYNEVQKLVTLYKSDVFPILNVQDADGANDGD